MAWFKVDDTLAFNAKVMTVGNEAIGLWVRAGSWCASQMTDGVIPKHVVNALCGGQANAEALASTLLEAGLWKCSDDVLDAYIFHDWSEYQPSAEAVRETRRKRAEAGRKGGLKSGLARASSDEANAKQLLDAGLKQKRTPSRPVPSRPNNPTTTLLGDATSAAPTTKGNGKRGTRLTDDFIPSESSRQAIVSDFPQLDIRMEHAKFVDHWIAQPGQKGVKLDWNATWRNWMRRAGGDLAKRSNVVNLRQQQTDDLFARAMARAEAAEAAAVEGRVIP